MTDEKRDPGNLRDAAPDPSRREFITFSVAAGLAAAAGSALAAAQPVVETNVRIRTSDGTCDAAFIHPPTGSHPGFGLADAFGLRPAMRTSASALRPTAIRFRRTPLSVAAAPVFGNPSSFNFENQADMARAAGLMGSVNARARRRGTPSRSWRSWTQSQVNKAKKIGTQGY
jgi:carboxymethylenebutenolidase